MKIPLLEDVEQHLRLIFAERKDHIGSLGVNTQPVRGGAFFFWYDYARRTHGRLCWCPNDRMVEVTEKILGVVAELRAAERLTVNRPKKLRVRRERGNLQVCPYSTRTLRVKFGSTLGRPA